MIRRILLTVLFNGSAFSVAVSVLESERWQDGGAL